MRGRSPGKKRQTKLRIYSGAGYQLAQEVPAGCICAVSGLTHTRAGQGLGFEAGGEPELLEPVLTYRGCCCRMTRTLPKPWKLCGGWRMEEPMLRVSREERNWRTFRPESWARCRLEILQKTAAGDRYGISASFGTGTIIYRGKRFGVRQRGVGHFEPLRHYAEVHLPAGARGAGKRFGRWRAGAGKTCWMETGRDRF